MATSCGNRSLSARKRWTQRMFGSAAAQRGGVVRRAVSNVKRYGSVSHLKSLVAQSGFHLIRTGDQYVVLCHTGDLRIIR